MWKNTWYIGNIYFIASIAVVGGGLFGFDIASMSAIIPTEQYKCYFHQGAGTCKGPKSDVQGGITASMPGGSYIGALASGYLSDNLGRKKAIMIGSVIWCIGCVLVAATNGIAMLIVGRFINGVCVGICSAQVPVYISELAPPSKRGMVVGAQQWAITWGIMIMFYISYGTSHVDGTAAFRIPWAIQALPAILLFFGMIFLPESPRWLARKDRWEECHSVLTLVHGKGDPNSRFVSTEFQEIKNTVEWERQNADVTYLELFKPKMINRTHIVIMTQVWSQLTGMNVMMYYISYVFTMAGLTNTLLVSSSIQYVINVVMTVPALLFVDKWGRRPTLLIGSVLMMTWLFAVAGVMGAHGKPAPPGGVNGTKEASWEVSGAASKAVIACSYLFVASYAPTWGPVSWIYPPEVVPLRVRGKAVALATSANWIFNFALAYFVPPAFVNIQWKVYIIFAVFCLAMTIHVYFMFPETAGKTLEEVESMFTDDVNGIKYIGIPAWKSHKSTSFVKALERGDVEKDGVPDHPDHSPERVEVEKTKEAA
ncbi:uncharacterized protein K452DRAFT_327499 [Aplosporella prunicola CBS 121167]|uniref:Major facilitator superfamily (MFS) profile domain-containing protein n=1 Tax=Aplosporella prunicola CBS 121167 TaxID=1176127 RepID=A0A6A6BAT3_9PEZI|nr:uncharacterized protein K452DRAFT_327499 [Aplosporella prunicola CBS 121167]KAF2140698.1 hypothetical protein K452DRAFT_327499 [Aplosporella prunicola CBS 121167]